MTYPNLDSRTINKTTIRVFLKSSGICSFRRVLKIIILVSQSSWNKQNGDYIKCVLYKENKEMTQVINLLAKMLR